MDNIVGASSWSRFALTTFDITGFARHHNATTALRCPATASVSPQQTAPWAPWGNGIALALSVYITANISGGHVNPAVTLAAMLTGHISIVKGLAFIIFQVFGACLGILMIAGLVPGSYVGMGNHGTGCFTTAPGVSLGMLFGWEVIMTFVLVSVVYAVAIGDPSFGAMGPLAVGLSLLALVFAGLNYTGTAINPARALGPAIVFHCHWDKVWLYVIAECVGGLAAGLMAGPLYENLLGDCLRTAVRKEGTAAPP
ncbi:hypothetical protein WJX79_005411 [Trebouxia sp. C0005]